MIPSFFANLVAISVERPSRRPALAVYVTNVVCYLLICNTVSHYSCLKVYFLLFQASETIYNLLVARGFLRPIPYGDIILFSITLACLFRWFHITEDRNNFLFKLLRFWNENWFLDIFNFLRTFWKYFRALVGEQELKSSKVNLAAQKPTTGASIFDIRHKLCLHNQGCLKYSIQVIILLLLSKCICVKEIAPN